MDRKDLIFFKQWFSDYCKSFYSSHKDDQKNIFLKEQHTFCVCENMIQIADEIPLNNNEALLAEAIALFHDVGRFPQYAKYKTFRDSNSENHGALGAKILDEKKVLRHITKKERELITQVIKYHNAFKIPAKQTPETVFFLKLIRDADKLDIWRVFLDYYESPDAERASAIGLGFSDVQTYSPEIVASIYKKQITPLVKAKTFNDYRLVQLSWIYDLNFSASLREVLKRDYINRIASYLPQTEDIKSVSAYLEEYIYQRVNEKDNERTEQLS